MSAANRPSGGEREVVTGCPWVCPVCRAPLQLDGAQMSCPSGHGFDVARQGYVNLLVAGQRRSRQPGDSAEMVTARQRFLATGAYDRMTSAIARVTARAALGAHERYGAAPTVVDIGCGDGHHTRQIAANVTSGASGLDPLDARMCGIDVAKGAVAAAARAHRSGWYAVASAADVPVGPATVDVALNVFGPVVPSELARVLNGHGTAVVVHPGPRHLAALRHLVYAEPRQHLTKDPLRHASEWFAPAGRVTVTFPLVIDDAATLRDLFAMTPYRWHAPPDIALRLDDVARQGFTTEVDVVISSYDRRPAP
ncbi:MAG: putative RNA methyltransferase [Acidimicrobiales bacterium]